MTKANKENVEQFVLKHTGLEMKASNLSKIIKNLEKRPWLKTS